jgi:hypothetical protein
MIDAMILEAIKKEIGRRNWNAYKLAEAVGGLDGSKDSVYRFLRGERDIRSSTLELIFKVLELEIKPTKKA